MQVTDAMVAKALDAYNEALSELTEKSPEVPTSLDDIREAGLRAALTAALAEMWRPMAPSDQYVTDIYTHLKGRIPMHAVDDVLRAANAVQTPPRGK